MAFLLAEALLEPAGRTAALLAAVARLRAAIGLTGPFAPGRTLADDLPAQLVDPEQRRGRRAAPPQRERSAADPGASAAAARSIGLLASAAGDLVRHFRSTPAGSPRPHDARADRKSDPLPPASKPVAARLPAGTPAGRADPPGELHAAASSPATRQTSRPSGAAMPPPGPGSGALFGAPRQAEVNRQLEPALSADRDPSAPAGNGPVAHGSPSPDWHPAAAGGAASRLARAVSVLSGALEQTVERLSGRRHGPLSLPGLAAALETLAHPRAAGVQSGGTAAAVLGAQAVAAPPAQPAQPPLNRARQRPEGRFEILPLEEFARFIQRGLSPRERAQDRLAAEIRDAVRKIAERGVRVENLPATPPATFAEGIA